MPIKKSIKKEPKKLSKLEEEFIEFNTPTRGEQIKEFIIESVKVILISLAIIIPVRYFLIQPFYVKGASMEPNFYDHEYLIIDEISYRFENPQRGDIIVFRYPRNPREFFIKRIVGLPGEKVEIKESKVFIYNDENLRGKALSEDYLDPGIQTSNNATVKLAEGEYFVLGDNRSSSLDSRTFGAVPEDFIIGRVWFRGWPFDRLKVFSTPEYSF